MKIFWNEFIKDLINKKIEYFDKNSFYNMYRGISNYNKHQYNNIKMLKIIIYNINIIITSLGILKIIIMMKRFNKYFKKRTKKQKELVTTRNILNNKLYHCKKIHYHENGKYVKMEIILFRLYTFKYKRINLPKGQLFNKKGMFLKENK